MMIIIMSIQVNDLASSIVRCEILLHESVLIFTRLLLYGQLVQNVIIFRFDLYYEETTHCS